MTTSTARTDQASIESSPGYALLDEPLRSVIAPRKPGDDLTLEQLSQTYNFRTVSDRRIVMTRQVIRECMALRSDGRPLRVLDIGCGRGMGRDERFLAAMRPWIDEFWGIEPDASVTPSPAIFNEVRHALLEDADLPEAAFDVAFSFMVMEHVADPDRFYRAVARCLRPGGVYLFMTPNDSHYFALATRTLKALRMEELVLRVIAGKSVDEYHYPVHYRCNSEARVRARATDCGFDRVDCAYLEADGPRGYMKGPLRPLFHLLAWKRTKIRRPDRLLTFLARMRRAQT